MVVVKAESADHAFIIAGVVEAEVGDSFGFVFETLVVMQILFHFGFFLLNIYDAKGFKEKKQRILEKVSSANKKNFLYI